MTNIDMTFYLNHIAHICITHLASRTQTRFTLKTSQMKAGRENWVVREKKRRRACTVDSLAISLQMVTTWRPT